MDIASSKKPSGERLAISTTPRVVRLQRLDHIQELFASALIARSSIEQRVHAIVDSGAPHVDLFDGESRLGCQRPHLGGIWETSDYFECLLGLVRVEEEAGECCYCSSVFGLQRERVTKQTLVVCENSFLDETIGLALRRCEFVDELLHLFCRQRTYKTVDRLCVFEREDRRDRLHLERRRDLRILVDVNLRESDRSGGIGNHFFDDRPEGLAGATPRSPQVDHDGYLFRALYYLSLECRVCHVSHQLLTLPVLSARRDAPLSSRLVTNPDSQHDDRQEAIIAGQTSSNAPTSELRESEGPLGIDVGRVTDWLVSNLDVTAPVGFELIAGGRSNLTYRVHDARGLLCALRRPPIGHVLPTAHDMTREHRLITALFPTAVAVARPLGICLDSSINGAPFFVMEFVDGHVIRDAPGARVVSEATRSTIGLNMAETLAELHRIDADSVGLGDLGRPSGYIERQIRRWTQQYRETVDARDDDLISIVASRLSSRVPTPQASAIVHGDYRLDNVVVDDTGRIKAVLDWEICTLGDPLADVGLLMVYWAEPDDDEEFLGVPAATTAPGFSTREDLLTRYEASSGRDLSDIGFYMAFGYWKLACILQGVFARYSAGAGAGDPASVDVYPRTIRRLAELAAATLE